MVDANVANSILQTTKQLSGVESTDPDFDLDVLIFINMTIAILEQIGIESNLVTVAEDTTWDDYIPESVLRNLVKAYIAKKVKLNFDPPTGGTLEALKESITELECRISYYVDPGVSN